MFLPWQHGFEQHTPNMKNGPKRHFNPQNLKNLLLDFKNSFFRTYLQYTSWSKYKIAKFHRFFLEKSPKNTRRHHASRHPLKSPPIEDAYPFIHCHLIEVLSNFQEPKSSFSPTVIHLNCFIFLKQFTKRFNHDELKHSN